MRTIKKIHPAAYTPIAYLNTYTALPTGSLDYLDPFLLLHHHGPQIFEKNNPGLPFGPHPHRGFETLTYIIKGDIAHQDSSGGEHVNVDGGVQWMTAGSGLIHSEVSSEDFIKNGGEEEILQLWMNLSAKHKMVKPHYVGLNYDEIHHFDLDDGKVTVDLISGEMEGHKGPIDSLSGLTMTSIRMKKDGKISLDIPKENQIFFYVAKGKLMVNGKEVAMHNLVQFDFTDGAVEVEALKEAYILFGHGKPFNEPVVSQGPFVMNTEKEIMEAYQDYRSGKMGSWGK
ncbi:MAG: pirin family protein [Sphingobacteriales bacterium]|nr:pirin family protein [Sphingobacteriales bacterium]